jgi:hypothetical protein
MLNYGKYAKVTKPISFHPNNRPEKNELSIMPNFLKLSWDFNGEITKETFLIFKKAIQKHMKTERFQKAFFDAFNVATIEVTTFPKDKNYSKNSYNGDWYIDYKSDLYFPIKNWFCPEFKQEWKRLDSKFKNDEKFEGYYLNIVFKKIHFLYSERLELMEISDDFKNKRTAFNTLICQAFCVDKSDKKMKEFIFKSTGRKIYVDLKSEWCLEYSTETPIITKPTEIK